MLAVATATLSVVACAAGGGGTALARGRLARERWAHWRALLRVMPPLGAPLLGLARGPSGDRLRLRL